MRRKIILASNNKGKLAQFKAWMLRDIELVTLEQAGFNDPIPEPFDTFHENANVKARTVFEACGGVVLSDDSGICVDALGGAPGVFSARYAGEGASDDDNNKRLLEALDGQENRAAHYFAVLCLISQAGTYYFEGRCDGTIALQPKGSEGFGYDPLFIPQGYDQSFAELPEEVKSTISHRGKALQSLQHFLKLHPEVIQ